ncbi:hypothetical protein ODJ79_00760 [Actinoplanes sp. KI2]|uniref:hypothetical protein n=1 Tax=Actinoplanes sp. KI2 TaxID=2983315 RepID=UPI0021D5E06E|nr:hypothetical protein [Actinoplanes sp. KI2]MCU7722237.1 hypothetical protein [Actinoplanes sp. KI2]
MTTAPTAPAATERFQHTVVAGWMRRLSENPSPRRNHWHTKLIYYRAAAEVLASPPRSPLNWRCIVDAVGSRGCRSTFYEVAGAHARHRMVDELINDGSSDSIQIALRYLRSDPVEQLIDETKVWLFWPYRQRLLPALATLPADEAEARLGEALTAWSDRYPAVARAVEHTPPACAVEDLTVIHEGRLSGTQATQRLTGRLSRC